MGRVASFFNDIGEEWISPEFRVRLRAVLKDVTSLDEYEVHLAGRAQFLLDAVLGYVTIEQNDLLKVLTIASVVGLPPTLIAGLYDQSINIPTGPLERGGSIVVPLWAVIRPDHWMLGCWQHVINPHYDCYVSLDGCGGAVTLGMNGPMVMPGQAPDIEATGSVTRSAKDGAAEGDSEGTE